MLWTLVQDHGEGQECVQAWWGGEGKEEVGSKEE